MWTISQSFSKLKWETNKSWYNTTLNSIGIAEGSRAEIRLPTHEHEHGGNNGQTKEYNLSVTFQAV